MPDPSEQVLTAEVVPDFKVEGFRCIIVSQIADPIGTGTLIVDKRIVEALAKYIEAFKVPKEPPDA